MMQGGTYLPDGYVGVKEASKLTGISESQLRRNDNKGLMVPKRIRVGNSLYRAYSMNDIRTIIYWMKNKKYRYENILKG